ncbi:MAG: LemA family protein [bacterium]|nr:LemA family protein [bacterium]
MKQKGAVRTGVVIAVIVGIVLIIGVWFMTSYNRLVTLNTQADTQWSQVETQYQRRFDLIPNLVESVKAVLNQEQEVFGQIAEARTRYSGATNADDQAAAANDLEQGLGRLLVIIENYPQLRSSETVQTLMTQIEGTENRISVERGRYNTAVQDYNLAVRRFPGSLFAGLFGFDERTAFEASQGAENAPRVQF